MSIVELLEEHGVEYKLHGDHHHVGRNWVGVDCPHCSPGSKSFKMGWSISKRYFNCWQCGPQRTGDTLELVLGVETKEAIRISRLIRSDDERHPFLLSLKKRGELKEPPGICRMAPVHKRYLENRGFDPDKIAKLWEVKGIGIGARLSWRLYIPIHDPQGDVVSWTTRSISKYPKLPKYVAATASCEKINHKHLLYGEYLVDGHAVVVCEGPTDVWAIGPGAVAITGINVSMQQAWRIAQYPVRVILFDNEPTAQRKADKLCEALSVFEGETYRVRLEHGKDACECLATGKGRRELEWLRERFLSEGVKT